MPTATAKPPRKRPAPTRSKARKPAPQRQAEATKPRTGLPEWTDLGVSNVKELVAPRTSRRAIDRFPTARVALAVLAACALFTLYVGHGYAMEETVRQVEELRRDNARLHLRANRLRGTLDRATGPRQILPGAALLGLEEGGITGPTITVPER